MISASTKIFEEQTRNRQFYTLLPIWKFVFNLMQTVFVSYGQFLKF